MSWCQYLERARWRVLQSERPHIRLQCMPDIDANATRLMMATIRMMRMASIITNHGFYFEQNPSQTQDSSFKHEDCSCLSRCICGQVENWDGNDDEEYDEGLRLCVYSLLRITC